MTIEAAFLDLMPSIVTVYPKTSIDAYGKVAVSSTGTQHRCRVQETTQKYRQDHNRDEFEVGTVIFYGVVDITTDSKIVLPDGTSPVILTVNSHNDDLGGHHTTITFGK